MAVMPIPQDWNGEDWKCWSIEWPDSIHWNAILRGFVTTPLKGRFWDERTGSIIDAQAIGQEIWNRNSPMEESLMSCNEDTLAVFERMATALEGLLARECCPTGSPGSGIFNSGSRGAGITPQQPNSYNEEDGEEEPPFGFDDWAEYRAHKCNAAYDLVRQLKVDMFSITNLIPGEQGTTAIITWVVTVLLTPIPYDDIVTLVALLTVAAFEYSFLVTTADAMEDNENDLVCELYSAPDAITAQNNLRTALYAIVDDLGFLSEVAEWVKEVINSLTPMDAFNRLFVNNPTTTQDGDCSDCEPETGTYAVTWGTETSTPAGEANPIIVEAANDGEVTGQCGADGSTLRVVFDQPVTITNVIVVGDGCGTCGGLDLYYYWSDNDFDFLIQQGNARPQDSAPVSGVQSLQFFFECASGVPEVTITYTID